jgi:hypothetical protein
MIEKAMQCRMRPGRSRVHLVVVGAFIVAAISALARVPQVFEAATPELVSSSKRALAPATFYRLDARLLVSAAHEIPRNATYTVIGGDRVPPRFVSEETTLLAYWLLPRRRTDAHSSDWIISIGGKLQSLGLRYAQVVRVGHDRELAEVLR